MTFTLDSIDRCFQRTLPGVIATSDRQGTPNVNYVTQIHVVDDRHLALSYQFSTKTRQNLEENPRACLEVYDPLTLDAYRLQLRFDHAETDGPLFEMLACRIEAMSSHIGLADIFKLRAAYVCEVLSIERRNGFIESSPAAPAVDVGGREGLTELRGMQLVSARINRAADLDTLLTETLAALDEVFGFDHGMILVPEGDDRLVAIALHGYGDAKVGAEVKVGDGLIGVVAKTRKLIRILGIDADLRHARAVRAQFQKRAPGALGAEIPLPGLVDASSQMAIPLLVQDRLLGVLALESRDTQMFSRWHEAFLQVLANQIASGMDRLAEDDDDGDAGEAAGEGAAAVAPPHRAFTFYRNDDCVFVDGEYLIRNVPGKILWKLLRAYDGERRTEFSNRELRLDPSLGLPAFKDNLESRLILLRKRLEQKCPEVQLVPTRRGRFTLAVTCTVELIERETA